MNDDEREKEMTRTTSARTTRSAAGFAAAQLTLFYLFWIMFFGEVIRWKDGAGATYRPIRDAFLIPFAEIFITPHHWVGKILTGTIVLVVFFFALRVMKRYVMMGEDRLIKNGYALIIAFWIYSFATLVYFIGHLNKFWFF